MKAARIVILQFPPFAREKSLTKERKKNQKIPKCSAMPAQQGQK